MAKKRIVMAIGHKDMGTNLPEQKEAVQRTAKVIADFIQEGWQVAIVHSNAPQVGMIHTAMNEFGRQHDGYSSAPMSVCSAMSQGYIGYDLQNGIRAELIRRGIYKPVSTVLTQVTVDPYDEAFYTPVKVIGRVMNREEADEEEAKGNHVKEVEGGFRRIVASPHPVAIVEIDAIKALLDADQIVIACGGGIVTRRENWDPMRQNSTVIYLRRDLELLPTSGRPVSQAIPPEELYRRRAPLYEELADLTVENRGTPEETAEEIIRRLAL